MELMHLSSRSGICVQPPLAMYRLGFVGRFHKDHVLAEK